VTFDGTLVWFARADELVAFDPATERVVRRLDVPGARAGTAFDGTHLYQLAGEHILVLEPSDGRVVRRLPAPHRGENSGMAWSDGFLWVGQYRAAKIHKLDAQTGELLKTLSSDRFVTGVSCVDGALWHAVSGDGECELRRLAPDGTVAEAWVAAVPAISGMEGTPEGFWCGGEQGKLRLLCTR
jgi:outer membrane protein assembly factor BamB